MDTGNYVTIPIDEYFELRQKAEMNMTMIREIAAFEERLNQFSNRMFEFDNRVNEIERRNNLNGKNNA